MSIEKQYFQDLKKTKEQDVEVLLKKGYCGIGGIKIKKIYSIFCVILKIFAKQSKKYNEAFAY